MSDDDDDANEDLGSVRQVQAQHADTIAAKFVAGTFATAFTSSATGRNRKYVVRGVRSEGDYAQHDGAPSQWPRCLNVEDTLVTGAMIEVTEQPPRLVALWVFSIMGDETCEYELEDAKEDVWKFIEEHEDKIDREWNDAFSVSSGDEVVPSFDCPALTTPTGLSLLAGASAGEDGGGDGGGGGGGGGGSPLTAEWACVRAEPTDGETVQALCERLQVTFVKGCGFYQLMKKESISATKELALRQPDGSWVVGGPDVRAALGLAAGAIKLAPGDLPAGAELFVQSTSPNRKLSGDGAALLRLPRGATTDALARRLTTGGKDNNDDVDNDEAAQAPSAKRARTAPAVAPKLAGLVQWSQLTRDFNDIDSESIDRETLVKQAAASQFHSMDCDEPVPEPLLADAIEWLALVMRTGSADWTAIEALSVPVQSQYGGSNRRFQWLKAAGARLMYLELGDDGDLVLMAVEADPTAATSPDVKAKKKAWGLVTGAAGAHPLIHAQMFQYANSDGSSSDRNLGELVNPTVVMAKFIHDTAMHGENGEH